MTITISPVTVRELVDVARIESRVFSDPWSVQSFREALETPGAFFAVARSDAARVVGYVVAWFVADQGEIGNLAVAPEHHGQGIGRLLLDAALAEADSLDASAVYLEVRESNEPARALYRSSGFEEVGRRRRYYQRPVEDAIVLRRTLNDVERLKRVDV